MLRPIEAEMLLHFHTREERNGFEDTPAGIGVINDFVKRGWIKHDSDKLLWRTTEQGKKAVMTILSAFEWEDRWKEKVIEWSLLAKFMQEACSELGMDIPYDLQAAQKRIRDLIFELTCAAEFMESVDPESINLADARKLLDKIGERDFPNGESGEKPIEKGVTVKLNAVVDKVGEHGYLTLKVGSDGVYDFVQVHESLVNLNRG